MNKATTVSSSEVMKANSVADTTLGLICGRVTAMNARKRFMPRLRATISCDMSKLRSPASSAMIT
ncbi:hypothetical protein D3C76_1549000 [compost metagenome]